MKTTEHTELTYVLVKYNTVDQSSSTVKQTALHVEEMLWIIVALRWLKIVVACTNILI